MKKKLWIPILWVVVVISIVQLMVFNNIYAVSWDTALRMYFGELGGGYDVQVKNEFLTGDELYAYETEVNHNIIAEGSILLKNDNNALPLKAGDRVSVFGGTSVMWMTKEVVSANKGTELIDSLTDAGLSVNASLVRFYNHSSHTKWGTGTNLGSGGQPGTWKIDEIPYAEYTDTVKDSYKDYADAAIVVLSRSGGEGGDLPRSMGRFDGSDDEHYLELTTEEKELLTAVHEAGFAKTIVILHTNNAMQLDFLNPNLYGVDAVLQIGGTGEKGVEVIGKLLTGEINPSGRTVNSFVYDNFSSPVMENFGDHRYTLNGELIVVDNYGTEAPGGTLQGTNYPGTFSYLNYGESIYLDYRYYETRYEDKVLGAANVGDYDYANTVYCSFGYGLGYTTFDWSDFTMSAPDADNNVTVSVKVKNTGSVAGKEVVEFYYQAPYTDDDKANLVEKASVNLIEFGKTKLLKPGESETVTASFNLNDMKSYDANKAKTYIMDEGTYYITAAKDAHAAVNNILAAKGYTTANGMDADGDAAMVQTHEVAAFTVLSDASNTGAEVTNQLDDVVAADATYLTRQNWKMIEDGAIAYSTGTLTGASNTTDTLGTVRVREITEEVLNGLLLEGWDASGNPIGRDDASWPEVQFLDDLGKSEADCTLKLDDMTGADYDDPRWDELLSEITYAEAVRLHAAAGWGTIEIPAIGKGQSKSVDGPQGIVSNINTSAGYRFPPQAMTAMTWNREIARALGDAISQEALTMGISSWWAPATNLYRSPFSGRNFEYCGVDGVYAGLIISPIIEGAMANGVTCQIKHIVINDQEVNRFANGRLATYATEQTVRELYLKPFEIAFRDTPVCSVMSTMTRIGTHLGAGHYNLNQNIMRGEFGLEGPIITDAQTYGPKAGEEILAGGSSMVLTTSATNYNADTLASKGVRYMVYQAAKDVLYMYTKNVASGITIESGFPVYVLLLIAADAIVLIYLLYGTFEVAYAFGKANGRQIVSDRAKWILRLVLWAIAAILLVILTYKFITEWGPMLVFAFQTIG